MIGESSKECGSPWNAVSTGWLPLLFAGFDVQGPHSLVTDIPDVRPVDDASDTLTTSGRSAACLITARWQFLMHGYDTCEGLQTEKLMTAVITLKKKKKERERTENPACDCKDGRTE